MTSLHPRPTATKIRALYTLLYDVLAKIPSFQSLNHGYQGMVDATNVYALTREAAWIDFPNPGLHRQADGYLNPVTQRNADTIFGAATLVYTS